jgi:phosphoglycerate dehydrogenase-like enzyme
VLLELLVKLVLSPEGTEGGTEPALLDRLRAVAPDVALVVAPDRDSCRHEIVDADAFYGTMTPDVLAAATRLRWIQSPNIGQESYMFPALESHPAVMTNSAGIYSDDIADHVLGYVLIFARGFHRYQRHQQQHHWAKGPGGYPTDVIHLPDATLGIFGLGGIGFAVAKRAHAFGMRVLAVDPRRTDRPPEVSELSLPDRLPDLLGASDFVVLCAPETPETRGLFDARVIGMMRPNAYLINIARGKLVRLEALVAALRTGALAGAGLDVFETEPLPAEHPLWDLENVVITPHVAGAGPHSVERLHAILLTNLRRFVNGEPLMNVIDKAHWY